VGCCYAVNVYSKIRAAGATEWRNVRNLFEEPPKFAKILTLAARRSPSCSSLWHAHRRYSFRRLHKLRRLSRSKSFLARVAPEASNAQRWCPLAEAAQLNERRSRERRNRCINTANQDCVIIALVGEDLPFPLECKKTNQDRTPKWERKADNLGKGKSSERRMTKSCRRVVA
jgi:hypothetical protein